MRAQNVMDNLIYRREIPVMIGVFINPGRRPDQPEPGPTVGWGDGTTNRVTEYNTPDDKYARVITEELMPALYKDYNISKDPDDHGIGGSSSGAIAAFGVAWARPDAFRKVLSNVGSFVDMRGGYVFADRSWRAKESPCASSWSTAATTTAAGSASPTTASATGSIRTSADEGADQEGLRCELFLGREHARAEISAA